MWTRAARVIAGRRRLRDSWGCAPPAREQGASVQAKLSGRLLDRGELPAVVADRSDERPVLLELHRLVAAAVEDVCPSLIGRVVEEAREEVHRGEVLAALLPRLGDLGLPHRDVLEAVDAAICAQSVAIPLEDVLHLGRQEIDDPADVACG